MDNNPEIFSSVLHPNIRASARAKRSKDTHARNRNLRVSVLLVCNEALRSDKMKSNALVVALGAFLSLSVAVHAFNLQSAHLVRRGFHQRSELPGQRYRASDLAATRGSDDLAPGDVSRRDILYSLSALVAAPQVARADLIQFPCQPGDLKNNYSFLRAGESLIEADGLWGSNPMFLTNRENALSENGIAQIQAACVNMMERDFNPSVVLFPTAANAIDTADIVASEMRIGRNRVLPEYTNLDGRGIGKFDMNEREAVRSAIWALDAESGPEGRDGERPPATDDGTPNETLANQITRLRQLMAVCETNFSGDDVLFVFPDNTGPALLSCMIAGVPVNRVHELEWSPGEVRYDIGMESTLARLQGKPSKEYAETIKQGKIQLTNFRKHPELMVNIKEKRLMEEVRAEEDRARKAKEAEMARNAAQEEKRAAVAKTEMARNAAQAEKRAKLTRFREPRAVVREEGDGGSLSDLMPLGVLGLAGAMATFNGGKEVQRENAETIDAAVTLDTESLADDGMYIGDTIDPEGEEEMPSELKAMEDLIDRHPIHIPEMTSNSLEGLFKTEQQTEEERLALAADAMDEYMKKDDGGDAWLQSVASIMEAEE